MKHLPLILPILSLAACGTITDGIDDPSLNDDTGDGADDGDSTGNSTGGNNGDGTGGGTACVVPAEISVANLAFNPGSHGEPRGGGRFFSTEIYLDDSATPDIFYVALWEGYGAFSGGLQTGTFALTGAETLHASCGACVFIDGDANPVSGPVQQLMALSGTLTLDSFPLPPENRLAGSVDNVTLSEVAWDVNGNQYVVPDGCRSTIDRLSFDVTVN